MQFCINIFIADSCAFGAGKRVMLVNKTMPGDIYLATVEDILATVISLRHVRKSQICMIIDSCVVLYVRTRTIMYVCTNVCACIIYVCVCA